MKLSFELLRRAIPRPLHPLAKGVYHRCFRGWLRLRCCLLDLIEQIRGRDSQVPVPPAMLRFRVGEDTNRAVFLAVGERSAQNLLETFSELGLVLTPGLEVLDFGCGCGRTLLWLERQFPLVHWSGTDTDAQAIAWCNRSMRQGAFTVNPPLPPLSAKESAFDVIYGISVFTHLDETAQRAWLQELHRVLKPGGVLLMSFYAEHVWKQAPCADSVAHDEFVFQTSDKLHGVLPSWYHTAFQSRARILNTVRPIFSEVRYFERMLGNQDLIAARKAL